MTESYEVKLRVLYNNVVALTERLLYNHQTLSECPLIEKEGFKNQGRMFGSFIYEMPNIWSGCSSIEAIQNKLNDFKYRPKKDHFLSRQRGGEAIVSLILSCVGENRRPDLTEVQSITDVYRQVHNVTKEENERVKQYMDKREYTYEQSYQTANVILIQNTHDLFSTINHNNLWKTKMNLKYQVLIDQHMIIHQPINPTTAIIDYSGPNIS